MTDWCPTAADVRIPRGGVSNEHTRRVQDGVVILQNSTILPNNTLVEVMPLKDKTGTANALIAVMEGEPHLSADDIAALNEAIAAGECPANW